VGPLTEAAAEFFQGENPDVRVTVGISGTGGGFEKFCAGETDISDASRRIEPDEEEACAAAGVEWAEVQVALDGIAVVVNPENDWADSLTVEQ
jgi:phosphate transport system substrate-binding protein